MTDVSIICTVYNHDRYLEKTFDGFLKQKTKFNYEILVNDDCSTDNSREIISKYKNKFPDIFRVFLQNENLYSQGKSPFEFLFSKAKGNIIMICEGDDFWVSENKLERQTEFLMNNKDYSLCVHSSYRCEENGKFLKKINSKYSQDCTVPTSDVIKEWLCDTATIAFRKEYFEGSIPFKQDAPCGDYPLLVYLSLKGKVYYLSQPMSAYRLLSNSSLSKKYQNNEELHIKRIKKMIDLLVRIDSYSNYKFSESVKYFKDKLLFDQYKILLDIKNIRNCDFYLNLSYLQKQKEIIKIFIRKKMPNQYLKLLKTISGRNL